MGFSRQEFWNELPFPSPGDLADAGIGLVSLRSPALAGSFLLFLPLAPPGKTLILCPVGHKESDMM